MVAHVKPVQSMQRVRITLSRAIRVTRRPMIIRVVNRILAEKENGQMVAHVNLAQRMQVVRMVGHLNVHLDTKKKRMWFGEPVVFGEGSFTDELRIAKEAILSQWHDQA